MKHVGNRRERVINTRNPDNCARCGSNAVRDMHPEDRANQQSSEAEAAQAIDAFFERNREKFKALVQTYGDGSAEALLDELRELFWTATPAGSA